MSNSKVIESNKKLSESILWDLQEKAYCNFGIDAWNRYGVPSYITSNSYIARAYAHVVLGFLRDCIANSSIDMSHPIYFFDLGAGTGRFAYFFLKEFFSFLNSSSLPKLKICYVMTDIVANNLDFWMQHPYLKPYFESGVLDCAIFHHAQSTPIHLKNQNITVSKDVIINPLILICNYFFDTIPQDLFRFKDGKLEEGRISLSVRDMSDESFTTIDPAMINKLSYSYSYDPLHNLKDDRFSQEILNQLESDSQKLDGTPFLFPSGAFQVINTFVELSKSRLLILAGDQGTCTIDQLKQAGEPRLSLHGSFSFPVSYNIISSFFQREHGTGLLTTFSDPIFVVMAGILGIQNPKETKLSFKEHLDAFEPTDFFNIVRLTEKKWKEPPLDHILLLIKLGNFDASVLLLFYPQIRKNLSAATDKQKRQISLIIEKVYEFYYPIGKKAGDFVFNLGALAFEIHEYEQALKYFQNSMHISVPTVSAFENIAACYHKLGKTKQANAYEQKAINLPLQS